MAQRMGSQILDGEAREYRHRPDGSAIARADEGARRGSFAATDSTSRNNMRTHPRRLEGVKALSGPARLHYRHHALSHPRGPREVVSCGSDA